MRLSVGIALVVGLAAGILAGYVVPWGSMFKPVPDVAVVSSNGNSLPNGATFTIGEGDDSTCSFISRPFIHPTIIKDMMCWLSDLGDQVVAINLVEAQGSNRYFGDIKVRELEGSHPYVEVRVGRDDFGYRYVGQTSSGVHVLATSSSGGSATFRNLLLLKVEEDKGCSVDWDRKLVSLDKRRLLLRKIGQISLGDRWGGELSVKGNELLIGKDEGWFAETGGTAAASSREDRLLRIDCPD